MPDLHNYLLKQSSTASHFFSKSFRALMTVSTLSMKCSTASAYSSLQSVVEASRIMSSSSRRISARSTPFLCQNNTHNCTHTQSYSMLVVILHMEVCQSAGPWSYVPSSSVLGQTKSFDDNLFHMNDTTKSSLDHHYNLQYSSETSLHWASTGP